jgi:hypothetical protein
VAKIAICDSDVPSHGTFVHQIAIFTLERRRHGARPLIGAGAVVGEPGG